MIEQGEKKYKSKAKLILSIVFFVIIVTTVVLSFVSWQGLKVSHYEIYTNKIKGNIRIVHLSDLHSTFWGENQQELVNLIDEQNPDIICFTGDIADDRIGHEGTIALVEAIGKKYKCYYVTGNHETYVPEGLKKVKKEIFEENGINVLDPGWEKVEVKGDYICICGIDDIEILWYDKWMENLKKCSDNKEEGFFSILLSHRPERYKEYSEYDFDLVLSGHAHGGQVRIPGICNGIYASNQGLFPDYAGGEYELDRDTVMIVSRGLVRNMLPRTFNPPEVGVIDIKGE